MDISILLALQDFRNGPGAFLAAFWQNTGLAVKIIIYCGINILLWFIFSEKEYGTYLLMGWSGNRLVNGALKITFCAYRPWIRDARIVPYGDAITTATGYSFPSGHTMNAATIFGGGAVRKDLPGVLRIVLGLLVLFVGFSRNFLGCCSRGGRSGWRRG